MCQECSERGLYNMDITALGDNRIDEKEIISSIKSEVASLNGLLLIAAKHHPKLNINIDPYDHDLSTGKHERRGTELILRITKEL